MILTLARSIPCRAILILAAFLLAAPPRILAEEEEGETPAAKAPAADSEEEEGASFLSLVHGDLTTRYLLRIRDPDTDQDIYQGLRVWGRDGGQGRFRFLLHGLIAADIDGRGDNEVFGDRGTLFSSNTHGYFYSAYVEANEIPKGWVDRLRVGRQFVHSPEIFHLDGATVRSSRWRGLSARGLVGIPVHLYESSARGDLIAGGGISYEPFSWGRLGADYVHVEDRRIELPGGGEDRETDDLYSVHALGRISTHTRLGGNASWIDDQFRRLDGRLHSRWDEGGLSGGLRFRYQPETLREHTIDLSPFYQVILESRPYYQLHAYVEKDLTEGLAIEVGGMNRQLLDDDDEGVFNRDFTRLYLTLHALDLPVQKVSASITGEAWLTETDDIYALGAEVGWRPSDPWRASTGYYFSLFKIDRTTFDERENVHTYFVRVRGPIAGPFSFLASYELEWGKGTVYHVMETGVRVSF